MISILEFFGFSVNSLKESLFVLGDDEDIENFFVFL